MNTIDTLFQNTVKIYSDKPAVIPAVRKEGGYDGNPCKAG